jgi:hypothetical protein
MLIDFFVEEKNVEAGEIFSSVLFYTGKDMKLNL